MQKLFITFVIIEIVQLLIYYYDLCNSTMINIIIIIIVFVCLPGNSEIQKTAQPDLETALELLEQYAPKISPIKALEVLPDTVPIGRIRHFLEASLQNQLNERRRTQVLKGLLHAEHLQVQEMRMHYESQSVLMTEFNICPVCKKRFGNQR